MKKETVSYFLILKCKFDQNRMKILKIEYEDEYMEMNNDINCNIYLVMNDIMRK